MKCLRYEFETGIVCDDIRREDNGKIIIIGAFARNIALQNFPAQLVLSCLVILNVVEPCELNTEFRASLDDDQVFKAKGKMRITDTGRIFIPLTNILIAAEKPCTLRIEMKVGRVWRRVCAVPLEMSPSVAP